MSPCAPGLQRLDTRASVLMIVAARLYNNNIFCVPVASDSGRKSGPSMPLRSVALFFPRYKSLQFAALGH